VEGLNIAEVLTADRVVSQILIEHPAVGYEPRVSFLGSRIDNLAIGGSELEVILDFDLLNLGPGIDPAEWVAAQKRGEKLPRFPKEPWTSNPWLLKKANEHMGLVKAHESMPDWLKHHFGWDTEKNEARWDNAETRHKETGYIACSLVKGVKGEFPGKAYGNVLEVPEFGKIFLGELAIYRGHFQLQMIRVELGCPVQGSNDECMVHGNGRTQP
jgi:hypothetical protein